MSTRVARILLANAEVNLSISKSYESMVNGLRVSKQERENLLRVAAIYREHAKLQLDNARRVL